MLSICHAWSYSRQQLLKENQKHPLTTFEPYSPHQHITLHLSSSHFSILHLHLIPHMLLLGKNMKGLEQIAHPGGNIPVKTVPPYFFFFCVISGVARAWSKAENFILLPQCLEDLGAHHPCCCCRYLARRPHSSRPEAVKQWCAGPYRTCC